VLKFPANSGDTVLYEQIATNWLKHHVYGMDVGGAITPRRSAHARLPCVLSSCMRSPDARARDARLWVMVAQIGVDLLSCLVIARLAALLACASEDSAPDKRVYSVALWLAVLCPFTANYAAVPLTEVFAVLWTGSPAISLCLHFGESQGRILCRRVHSCLFRGA